ncbi:MAG: conjugative transposon protein TraK [Chitinophagaceae bacterium]
MFRQTKNIDTAFRQIRLFSVIVLFSSSLIALYSVYKSDAAITASQRRIYILANGKALEAYAAERKDNIPVEARDHVRMFHYNFFTLDPDENVIRTNITKALYLADGTAKRQYDNLKETGYYAGLISGNISQELITDSIRINTDSYPYYFEFNGEQKIIRPGSVITRSLISEGYLRSVSRSDNNPHGFLIERWRIVENKDLKTESR